MTANDADIIHVLLSGLLLTAGLGVVGIVLFALWKISNWMVGR